MKLNCRVFVVLMVMGFLPVLVRADDGPDDSQGSFKTQVAPGDLDPDTYAEWVDGAEKPIPDVDKKNPDRLPSMVVVTNSSEKQRQSFIDFGKSKTPGVRHLRVGFTQPISVGSIYAMGNVRISVLKTSATYPGDLTDDSQWIPAQRIEAGKTTDAQTPDRESAAFWVLPEVVQTRAIRVTHESASASDVTEDGQFGGHLFGLYVLPQRVVNSAPEAKPVGSGENDSAKYLNNEIRDHDGSGWENIEDRNADAAAHAKQIVEDSAWAALVWSSPVTLNGMGWLGVGFSTAEIQAYTGPEDKRPLEGSDQDWVTVSTVPHVKTNFPMGLSVSWVDFGKAITTRAIRVRITAPILEEREHTSLRGKSMNGKRVWMGELIALHSLDQSPIESALIQVDKNKGPASYQIPIPFTMPEDGFVTLVIEDKDGKRIRNLISETPYSHGPQIAYWDGTDDLGRDVDAAKHGLYRIPAQVVAPGDYKVRGLWRKALHASYEFNLYGEGNPPWSTSDHTGAWLANHTPPQSALFLPPNLSPSGQPCVMLGAFITEGPDGLIWVDLDGKKRGGVRWIGGDWTSAPFLARDDGSNAAHNVQAYVASVFGNRDTKKTYELRITGFNAGMQNTSKASLVYNYPRPSDQTDTIENDEKLELGGVAAFNGKIVCSLTRQNKLIIGDVTTNTVVGEVPLDSPRGAIIDPSGSLWILSGKHLVRFDRIPHPGESPEPQVVIDSGLEDPCGITLDDDGNIYISDRGSSNQVKVFTRQGQPIRDIGKPGVPQEGPYDPMQMNNPAGIAVDSEKQLWVAENDFLPKRVSVWTLDGKFVKAFYGPTKYGGGGSLDSQDKTRFYYADEGNGVMEFKLDWDKGISQLAQILYRPGPDSLKLPEAGYGGAMPEKALYHDGARFFTNCYNSNPTNGAPVAFIFKDKDGVIRPCAAMGMANYWDVLKGDTFMKRWPPGVNLREKEIWNDDGRVLTFFTWSDLNGDGIVQPDEVTMEQARSGGVTVLSDLSFCISRLKGQATQFTPTGFTDGGVPTYDLGQGKVLLKGVQGPTSSGGDQMLVDDSGNAIDTLAVDPFPISSLCGGRDGTATWSYPSLWPGLHASHESPAPDRPGELVGTTRLMGDFIQCKDSDAGPLWCVNTSIGAIHLFTSDGLFVATPFFDRRLAGTNASPTAVRGMSLDRLSLGEENFWLTISQAPDGKVYLLNEAMLIRLDGLETVRRIPSSTVKVSPEDLGKAQAYRIAMEEQRKSEEGEGTLPVSLNGPGILVDGRVNEWPDNSWVTIDHGGTAAFFDSQSTAYDIRGAVAVKDSNLYAAWKTGEPNLLANSGEMPIAPFKTGGTLELMLGTNPNADPARQQPVAGDMRLLVTKIEGHTKALLYRAVVPGTSAGDKVPFSSPWRTINFDKVDDISDSVQLGSDGKGNYEISVPLDALGLKPVAGMKIKGDIGILRGDGSHTVSRNYWSNKATAIVSDVPSEAELMPALWGTWEFEGK
jgi:hypothetical protein